LKSWLMGDESRTSAEVETSRTMDLLVDDAERAVLSWNEEGIITRWNRAAEQVFGWAAGEVVGRPCPVVVLPEGIPLDAAADELPVDREHRIRTRGKGGAVLDLTVLVSGSLNGGGIHSGRVAAVVDRGMERVEGPAAAPSLFDRTPFGVVVADGDGRILEVNPAACALLGRIPGELVGTAFLDAIRYPRNRIEQAMRRGVVAGDSFRAQVHLVRSDHDLVTADLTIESLGGTGSERRIACFLSDATEQVAAERRRTGLLRLEQKARVAAEAAQKRAGHLARMAGELTFSLDYDQTLRRIAELAVQGFASYCVVYLREGESMIRVGAEAYAEADGPRLRESCSTDPIPVPPDSVTATTLSTGHPLLINGPDVQIDELFGLGDDHRESLKAFDLSSAMLLPLRARGTVHGAIAFFKRGEEAGVFGEEDLRFAESLAQSTAFAIDNAQLYRTAQRAVAAREELLAIVAHDLRSPLGAISVSTEMLQEFTLEEHARQYHLEIIQRASGRMSRLIQDLLDVSKIELRQLNIDPQQQEVLPILEEAHALFETRARAKLINFTYEVELDVGMVFADRYRVLQVLSNLLENAIKFSSPHGNILMRVEKVGGGLQFSVADEGPGIVQDDLPRIFDRFWQAKRNNESGAGLGLAISKGIVEAHGGSIWVASKTGEGTHFGFILPDVPQPDNLPPKSSSRIRQTPGRTTRR
jgi:PAS domain S-box-containing protein